ncbi:hypothetical protein J437_LFUL009425 [Ladona fulva]|uniref:Pyridoxal kinase n=1 Tax=Ladona fulva TaxID=123851 RepID=A0A8K0P3I6_LADFU|nr:hypothetical protein J437_LFUL009425 [Ladona fulva]
MGVLRIMSDGIRKVLSIQSHVVSGYVGNKSATFPLQLLGFEVDGINSVQFSNHTGYGYWKGQVLNESQFGDLMNGLRSNGLDNYSHLLTGYIGSESFLLRVVDVVRHLRKVNRNLVYVCDPVLGDNGHMYVPKEMLPLYRDRIISLSNILTPNQFEAELLTGEKINNLDDAVRAMKLLHAKGCDIVVLSSSDFGSEDHLLALASSHINGKRKSVVIKIPRFKQHFTGTGDLFTALFLAWMSRTQNDLKTSMEKTIATMQTVLKKTVDYSEGLEIENSSSRKFELRLIQSKVDIENPNVVIKAEVLQT